MKKVTMGDIPRTEADMAPLGSGGLMTGTQVWRQSILNPDDSNNFNFAIVAFDAGSRNKFHKHSGDQILVITEGTGKVASDDEVIEVSEGDVVVIPAGENHWHGAPDGTAMAHITITVKGSQTEQTEA
jgi:quercetin dioxygenase-like cupin family protein